MWASPPSTAPFTGSPGCTWGFTPSPTGWGWSPCSPPSLLPFWGFGSSSGGEVSFRWTGTSFFWGGFYVLTLASYLFFEVNVINCRPVLIGGALEASYPSSTTLLTLCIMPTARWQLDRRLRPGALRSALTGGITLFTLFMVIGRLVSGVHWLSDIVGGALLSGALVTLYFLLCALCSPEG